MQLEIRKKLESYKRILQIARKPTLDEFKDTAKICAAGILVIGIIGFILYFISIMIIG